MAPMLVGLWLRQFVQNPNQAFANSPLTNALLIVLIVLIAVVILGATFRNRR